jgi:hypothetical protein
MKPAPEIGTRFDHITTEIRPDYGAPGKPIREMHIYRQADGRELKCKGLGWCRECNKAEGLV